ncbi:zinc finger MYM-type protein 1-like [Zingiber officinale]|uniref:zinc finger MYM-type protein 1-like n=1 Tax=Zingiber officinale TaxID=94328 RepID=UPI001C4DA86A|nr:zinc finger MYM-type protein 1-like [Zingiber officinale]
MIKFMGKMNENIGDIVLEKAPKNAKHTSPDIQKDILNIFANQVRTKIRKEIGDAKFCILVDEARDTSNKEQMTIVLRFVDIDGFLRERFFAIVHVTDTTAATLKKKISNTLGCYDLHIHNMRGQGYDGASNMRGSWNGLQALFLKDCSCAYYVHCFAHRLQLALTVAAEKEVSIWLFFSKLNSICNLFNASPKRHAELLSAQKAEVAHMVAIGERDTGRGCNQIGNLLRPGKTGWSSNFDSICNMIDMYSSVITVLENMVYDGSSNSIRGEVSGLLIAMKSFDFIFILHLMQKIMGLTNLLCRALQEKSLDILNAMDYVSTTKTLLQILREEGFAILLTYVKEICAKYDIEIPQMEARYKSATGRSCQQNDSITVEHHYRFDVFTAAIDFQVEELNSRFKDEAVELLKLSCALEPKESFKLFNVDHIYRLAEKFYPLDFDTQDLHHLRMQLEHYKIDIVGHERFQNLSTISELCRRLIETNKSGSYNLIDRLIRLVLTLPVSTATTERAFSAMKLVKTALRNKMEEEFLTDSMVIYIERELAETIDNDIIINEFDSKKNRRAQLQ